MKQDRKSHRRWWLSRRSCRPWRWCNPHKSRSRTSRRQTRLCRRSCKPWNPCSRNKSRSHIGWRRGKWPRHRSCMPARLSIRSKTRNHMSRRWCWPRHRSCKRKDPCNHPRATHSCRRLPWPQGRSSTPFRLCSPALRPRHTRRPCRCQCTFHRSSILGQGKCRNQVVWHSRRSCTPTS